MSGPAVAVVYPGEPSWWAGVPAGLMRGLEELGARVTMVDARPPRPLALAGQLALVPRYFRGALPHPGRVLALADLGPELGTLRSRATRRRLREAGPFDAVVQIGTDYPIRSGSPIAVVQDRTVQQALSTGYPRWLALPEGALRTLVERQAEAYANARACCLLTPWPAESLVRDHGVPREKVHVVGFGPNNVAPPEGRDWSKPRFLFIGREWDRKRGDAVMAAFARLRERVPDATLDVVGGHPPLREPGVTGHGNQPAGPGVSDLLGAATCLVVPSLVEPAGIVYVEAGASGIASIGTTVGGAAKVIGDAGRTVAPGDDDGLLEAMLELADPGTARELGERARERSRPFTWRSMAARTMRALGLPLPPDAADVPPLA